MTMELVLLMANGNSFKGALSIVL